MKQSLLAAVISTLPVTLALAQSPEIPAIWREVTGVIGNQHQRPHVPAFRTSTDGRVGIRVKGAPTFALMMPEKLAQAVLLSPAGSYTMSSMSYKYLDGYASADASAGQFYVSPATSLNGKIAHCCLYDPTPAMSALGEDTNPKAVSGEDVYDLNIFVIFSYNAGGIQFFVTPVKVYVQNPKTSGATIRSIARNGLTVAGPVFSDIDNGFEPMIAGDGHLLVTRISGAMHGWTDPVSGAIHAAQGLDIVYSYYPAGAVCDPTKWVQLIPISHAYNDTRINTQFGFAMAQFRDAEGTPIPDGEDIGGTYPWMDRQARNLFFTGVRDTLLEDVGSTSRYPQVALTPPASADPDETSPTRGVCFAGLWSHGKIVLVDNLNSDQDYGLGNSTGDHRMVGLFAPGTAPEIPANGWLRMGASRENNNTLPPGDNANTTIMDSLENIFNYKLYAPPITIRDVVWPFSNAKQTDELVFDDYVDPDAFIVTHMTGLLTFDPSATTTTARKLLIHYSGWDAVSNSFSLPVKLQNAATSTSDRWVVPANGAVTNGRLEPAATGGIHGKGLWMSGSTGLSYTVPAQPQSVSARDWYVGLFVDCRFADNTAERLLLTFPDNSKVRVRGRNQVLYEDAAGNIVNRVTLPPPIAPVGADALNDVLPDADWAHLAWQVRNGGKEVDFHLNGLLYNRWQDTTTALFQMTPGTLTVGKVIGNPLGGFRGWIDEFKILAHSVDAETACNHAGGTLIGLPVGYSDVWKSKFADRYPSWAHEELAKALSNNGEVTYPAYANFHDYTTDNGVYRGNIPAGAVSLRQSIHFPEGPLFRNRARPHSGANNFCLTCHTNTGNGGLDLAALDLVGAVLAPNDARRQPMQPFRRLFGNIPAGLVNTVAPAMPAAAQVLAPAGQVIDNWMLPNFASAPYNSATAVQSFTLVNADTGRDLMPLTSGAVLDSARIGTSNLTIRANLDYGQGNVTMKYDSNPAVVVNRAPYTVFWTAGNPNAGMNLTAGAHTVQATPSLGTLASVTFTVAAAGTARPVANYRTDFRTHSPLPGWRYQWNATGAIGSPLTYRALSWSPALAAYTADGTPIDPGNGRLDATGGYPGQGVSPEGYAIAAYTVKRTGYYAIGSGSVTDSDVAGNGIEVRVYTQAGSAATSTLQLSGLCNAGQTLPFSGNVGQLNAGDTIHVAIGPRGNATNDAFTLNFDVLYKQTGDPL